MAEEKENRTIGISFKRSILWMGLILIILLVILSVYGAFIGAEKAQLLFSSTPLTFYWILLFFLLIAALFTFRRRKSFPLLSLHLGCILIILGSMWASESGHELQKRLFGIDKLLSGTMTINEGETSKTVKLPVGGERELPFSIRLNDFRVEKYEPGSVIITDITKKKKWSFPARTGEEYSLGKEFGSIKIVRLYRNFRIDTESENRKPFDDAGEGENRAVEILVKDSDGHKTTEYVFEKFEGHEHPGHEKKLMFRYVRMEKDYFSDIEIWDGETIVKKTVEVNRPIHYGGYYFYQYGWDPKEQKYTVLNVTSDSGIPVVFAGFITLIVSLIWHLWAKPIFARIEIKSEFLRKNGD